LCPDAAAVDEVDRASEADFIGQTGIGVHTNTGTLELSVRNNTALAKVSDRSANGSAFTTGIDGEVVIVGNTGLESVLHVVWQP